MRRLALSAASGFLFTTFLLFLPISVGKLGTVRGYLLFWFGSLISWSWLGLDCHNADSISDKMSCVFLTLAVDLLAYSVLFYLLFWIIDKCRRQPKVEPGLSIK